MDTERRDHLLENLRDVLGAVKKDLDKLSTWADKVDVRLDSLQVMIVGGVAESSERPLKYKVEDLAKDVDGLRGEVAEIRKLTSDLKKTIADAQPSAAVQQYQVSQVVKVIIGVVVFVMIAVGTGLLALLF